MNVIYGRGRVYLILGRLAGGELYLGDTPSFTLHPSRGVATRMTSNGGPLYAADSAIISQEDRITFTTTQVDLTTVGELWGGKEDVSVMPLSPHTFPQQVAGSWVQAGGFPRKMSAMTCAFNNEPSPVEGVHYAADLETGRVQVLQSGLGAFNVYFTTDGGVERQRMVLSTEGVRCGLRLVGENPACGRALDVYVTDGLLTTAGDIALKGDWAHVGFEYHVLGRSMRLSMREPT